MTPKNDSFIPDGDHPDGSLRLFKFEDTGRQVFLRKASPVLMMELRSRFPAPLPPKQPVDYGGDIGVVMEFNEASPDHRLAVEAHETMLESMLRKLLIKRAVVLPGPELDKINADVEELKADWLETTGTELTGSLEFLYVSYICIGSETDLQDVLGAITRSSFRSGAGGPGGDPGAEADVPGA